MTRKVFYQDPYQRQLDCEVVAVEPAEACLLVTLDATICYPNGGGQPGDQGRLLSAHGTEYPIADTRYAPDRRTIIHSVEAPEAALRAGEPVRIELDWERRHRLMRMHTTLHLMCALISAPVTGGNVGERESRCEFDIETADLDKNELSEQLNALVQSDCIVEIGEISDSELDARPELVRTMSVQPPRGQGSVRMIRIVDAEGELIDYQPCGGTHVARTAEIGAVRVTRIKSKGRRNKRVNVALLEG